MVRLENKIALVTGAGAGIGLEIAHLFAQEGAIVYLTDIADASAATAAHRMSESGLSVIGLTCDVSKGQDVAAVFQKIDADNGRLDVVVNNAGLNVRGDFRHMSDADWEMIREVNLDGVMRIARDGFELMRKSGAASLINLASIMGHRGLRQLAGYAATKGAVSALTRALAVEYAPFGIRVNSLAPGFIETALTERVLRNPMFNKALIDKTPLRRFGEPKDVARAALFFASEDAAFITGAELAVDGGMAANL